MIETFEAPVEAPVETKTKTAADVLRHAALIIEEHGWNQGNYMDAQGHVCAMGAIGKALGAPWYDSGQGFESSYYRIEPYTSHETLHSAAVLALMAKINPGDRAPRGVPEWNDDVGRTRDEVIAALRAAADATDR